MILGLVGIAVVMGLIEWNARRQAAAITREMFRPATADETRAIKQVTHQAELEAERALIDYRVRTPTPRRRSREPIRDLTPLAADERCINGQRFRRVSNGWIQNGTC